MDEQLDLRVFGERLRTARKHQGMSQQQLGALVGADAPWISNLEKGKQSGLAAKTVYRFCRALGVSADYLLGLTDAPTPPRRRRGKAHDADAAPARDEVAYARDE